MTIVKICGITNKEDALAASRLGVDMLGFVFYRASKRYVSPETAKDIVGSLAPFVARVGVFVDEKKEDVLRIATLSSLDILQFHGGENPDYCSSFRKTYKVIKAFRVKAPEDLKAISYYDCDFYLFDAYDTKSQGGTGKVFDWKILKGLKVCAPVILSGGLTPGNVSRAIRELLPYGVDVSSGVERSPGKKDLGLMKRFVENARRLD